MKSTISFEAPVRRDGTREGEVVSFEAVIPSESRKSMFEPGVILTPGNIDQFSPSVGAPAVAAKELQRLGFRILHVGAFSVSGEAARERWNEVFGTEVKRKTLPFSYTHPELGE